MAARSSISRNPCRKKGQSPTSVTGRRTRQRQAASFEFFSPQIVWSKSARWPMGMASCLRSTKKNATFLLADHETTWWWRMQSPACRTGARRHGHQICADPDQDENVISVNEQWEDAAERHCSCPLHRKKHCTPRKKNSSRSGFVTTLLGDVTLRHPQPVTNSMNCSLASNVVSS